MSGEAPRDHAPRAQTEDLPSSSRGGLPGLGAEAELAPRAPVAAAGQAGSKSDEMPRTVFTRRRLLLSALFVGSCVAFLYFVLPKVLGLKDTWSRIQHGDPWWLAVGALLECLFFLGYVVLFRGVFVRGSRVRIGLKASYEITMAGLAATRLLASAEAGGIALTAWALRRSGMEPRTVAQRMVAFNALLYAVFMGTLLLDGLGLFVGVLSRWRLVRAHAPAGAARRRDPRVVSDRLARPR